ncbi:hypothetical protein VCHENC02_4277, partial [Vibrio harveyi]
LTKSS